jgi:O-antigen ligase
MTAGAGIGAARALRAAGTALPVGLGVAAAAGAIALLVHPDGWTVLTLPAGVALAALAWLRPVTAVALLLALSPICGHRPTTGPFVAFVALTACAVPGWLARLWTRDRAAALDLLGTPAGLALTGYVGASVLSLSSLPLYAPADIVGAATAGDAIRLLPGALAAADVTALIYPVLTVLLTLHAAVAALTVAVAVRAGMQGSTSPGVADAALQVTGGILAGLVLTIAAGALDRLGYLDLRVLRATDPFTNLSGADRLQSTFGHAGWFAEYLCFATPAILALWLWPAGGDARGDAGAGASRHTRGREIGRVVAASALLIMALVAVVLSYQRGGWITWALVAAGVVAAIVWLAAAGTGKAAAAVPLRHLVAIGAAAAILAIAAGLVVVRMTGGPGAMDRFAARARTITQVSDRQAHVTAGLRLGALLPILGGGSESFAMRYEQQYLRAGGAFYARGYSPLLNMYGSAHNVFAQTFAGKGAIGLIALVLLVLTSLAAAVRTLRRPDTPPRRRVVAMIALGMIAAFALYGQVQEVFYVAPLQLTVFAAFGMAVALDAPPGTADRSRRSLGIVAALLAVGLAAHVVHAYALPGRLADEYRDREISLAGERLSPPVLGEDGQYFQWTGARAVITVPRQATELSFDLRQGGTAPRDVEVRFDGRSIDRVRLEDGDWRHLVYPLRRLKTLPRRLEIVVVPGADGAAGDRGVAMRRIRWGLP